MGQYATNLVLSPWLEKKINGWKKNYTRIAEIQKMIKQAGSADNGRK